MSTKSTDARPTDAMLRGLRAFGLTYPAIERRRPFLVILSAAKDLIAVGYE